MLCSIVLFAKSGLGDTIGVVPLGVARALRDFSILFGSAPVADFVDGVLDALVGRLLVVVLGSGGRLLSIDSRNKLI